ncbi:MAG: amidase [Gammaproteobacteria bacterium]|jgi:amidase|nr:MAG: amidase [Gammaproteobacteria bacterium]
MIFDSAHEILEKIKQGEVSSLEVLESFLAQVEKVNPKINAIVALDIERAKEKAKEADNKISLKSKLGPLHGLPMTIKDAFEVEGIVSTGGNPAWKDNIPKRNAEAVQRLVDAGAIIFGKTNVPFLSSDLQSFNKIYGTTNNPWDLERTPGGSSGGSAAALAAGMTPLELGSDIGGSIRVPAHFCGLYGHKPSYNIISEVGHMPPPPGSILTGNGLSVAGPLARSPEDLEIALDVLVAAQEQDSQAWKVKLPKARTKKIKELKIAVWPDEPYAEADDEITSLIKDTAEDLRHAGAKVETVDLPISFEEIDKIYSLLLNPLMLAGSPKETFETLAKLNESLDPNDVSELAKVARGSVLKHADWVLVNAIRQNMRQKWREFFNKFDVILCPTCITPAFKHNHNPVHERKLTINGKDDEYLRATLWAGPAVSAGLPSTNVPIGMSSNNLPISMQITGPYLEDKTCLEVAKVVRNLRGGFKIPPNLQ